MQWVVFRVDASIEIGSGHIMRCLTLANELKYHGKSCVFITRNLPENLSDKIEISGHEIARLSKKENLPASRSKDQYSSWLGTTEIADATDCLSSLYPFIKNWAMPELVICDHYGLSAEWEKMMRENLKSPIAIIDDLSNRKHDCDWLIDTTFGKSKNDYSGLVPEKCKLMIGSQYALLRPEFAQLRKQTLKARDDDYAKKQPVKNLLISMGGVDKDNITMMILKTLSQLDDAPKFIAHILIGGAYPHFDELKLMVKNLPFSIKIHQDISNVASLFAMADICIGASGSSTWERACLGLPTINIVLAKNQNTIAQKMVEIDAIVDAGEFEKIDRENFINNFLNPMLNDINIRHQLSINSRKICDGEGAQRINDSLLSLSTKHNKQVKIRQASENDIELVYNWQCLPETRKYSNNSNIPSWEEHQSWMQKKLLEENSYFYIIKYDKKNAGVVRLEMDKNSDDNTYIISIFIAPKFFGYGIASAALQAVANYHKSFNLIAQVKDNNKPSINLFLRNGYKKYKYEWYKLIAQS